MDNLTSHTSKYTKLYFSHAEINILFNTYLAI